MAGVIGSEELVSQLKAIEGDVAVFSHAHALTVDAWKAAVGGEAAAEGASIAKNLLLRDKNNKLYHVVALESTEVDLKTLSLRLGLGKKLLRMAPAEALGTVLQVPEGCLTPFALSRPDAKDIVLILDDKLKGEKKVFFHPLRNDQSVSISPQGLQTYLSSIGHAGHFVDLSIRDVKVGKDNPPDLKALADGAKAYTFSEAAEKAADKAAPPKGGKSKGKGKGGDKKGQKGSKKAGGMAGDDVHGLIKEIQEDFFAVLAATPTDDKSKRERILKDLEMRLNAFKNVAYTRGYKAAKTEIISMIKA
mmetsp:Transcript_9874/g.19882  ORF Transcript_9874/g.19882 Transcript_9874/m.19882 type:complete len:305 (-) Transcript_9874:85-999(-)